MDDQTTYVLAKCRNPADAAAVVERLQEQVPDDQSTFTSDEFSFRSRMHWLTKTKAGIALGYAAALGLLVGAVVTYQTLSAATKASLREYAVLRALGIPRWRMALAVMAQSFWVGVIGVGLSLPAVYGLACVADRLGPARESAVVAAADGGRRDAGDGAAVGPARPADAAPGRAGDAVALTVVSASGRLRSE